MLSENILFFAFNNKKQKTIFDYQTFFFLENKNLFLKTIFKQALEVQ